jgi:hypothetical protein
MRASVIPDRPPKVAPRKSSSSVIAVSRKAVFNVFIVFVP